MPTKIQNMTQSYQHVYTNLMMKCYFGLQTASIMYAPNSQVSKKKGKKDKLRLQKMVTKYINRQNNSFICSQFILVCVIKVMFVQFICMLSYNLLNITHHLCIWPCFQFIDEYFGSENRVNLIYSFVFIRALHNC